MKAYNLRLKVVSASMKIRSKDTEGSKKGKKDPFCSIYIGDNLF